MLIDKLRQAIAPEENAEVVKPGDYSLKLDYINKKDRHRDFLLSNVIKKSIL